MEVIEEDPLKINVNFKPRPNPRGRPPASKIIKFGPQPQSVVSKILSGIKDCKDNTFHQWVQSETGYTSPQKHQSSSQKPHTPVTESIHLSAQECVHDNTNSPVCTETKRRSSQAKTNIKTTYTCNYSMCTYQSTSSSNVLKHKRTHTNEKPYLCDQCTFRSNFVNSLKTHKRIHYSEKPYCCELCGYRCNSSSNLKKHKNHMHLKK